LLGSCIGVLFRKPIAYYATYIGFLFIGLSGMTKNLLVGLGGSGYPITWEWDTWVYVVIPIGIMVYLFYDLKKIKI